MAEKSLEQVIGEFLDQTQDKGSCFASQILDVVKSAVKDSYPELHRRLCEAQAGQVQVHHQTTVVISCVADVEDIVRRVHKRLAADLKRNALN